jgi:preprotein translocase subunit SecE
MRQGQVEDDDALAPSERTAPPRTRPDRSERSSPPARVAEFAREVRSELRQVAWPTRPEVINSATVVFITLVILVLLIFALNYTFSHSIAWLYRPAS